MSSSTIAEEQHQWQSGIQIPTKGVLLQRRAGGDDHSLAAQGKQAQVT